MQFVIGQRWVSQAEPQLGLGIIVETDGRHITVNFPASEEDRIYAANSAPLARLIYEVGDTFHDTNQVAMTVVAIEDLNGLKYYLAKNQLSDATNTKTAIDKSPADNSSTTSESESESEGDERIVPETQISGIIQLSSPTQRLYSGQFDKNTAYQLRTATLHFRFQQQKSKAKGLLGARTNLLPHQIYIAHEVASRFAPRVLLADEVGLGKTIEAGMILHQQLHTGLASRALIVVPEPLLHQWLVEMLRKFNLHFSLFDRARYDALLEAGEENPFESEQLILCSLDLFTEDKAISDNLNQADWDLVVVDEAHHLIWSEASPSKEYQAVEALSQQSTGLLLLTATPEQLGIASHFARLRLLDPARFNDLDAFTEQQSQYIELNSVVVALSSGAELDEAQNQTLAQFIGTDNPYFDSTTKDDNHATLIQELLDRHGTGRVLFRNTRTAIENFPKRIPNSYPLQFDADLISTSEINDWNPASLHPEVALQQNNQDWLSTDPRVEWLKQFLRDQRGEKVLLICANASTAIDLEKHLQLSTGIRSSAFYEGLSIIERDRAAAYFADDEMGAQVLICSEIGSEGRNFQFSHHLVLFDLPTNPDLLEQRIGRLDRIGQTQDIQIHIPYIAGSAQAFLFRWYHEGVSAFSNSFSGGLTIYREFESQLADYINGDEIRGTDDAFEQLIVATAKFTEQVRQELKEGRDQLLELNSCNKTIANAVIDTIVDSERSDLLESYTQMIFDTFGVEYDFHSEHSLVLQPGEQMLTEHFPGLREEGVTITYNREKAQVREDMEFITWENPMVTEAMDMILGTELGNVAIGATKLKSIPSGTFMVECFFAMQCSAPKKLQVNRFLPATPIRVLLDSTGKDLTATIKHAQMNKLCEHVKKSSRLAIVKQLRSELEKMISTAQLTAQQKSEPLIQNAIENVNTTLIPEKERLEHLKQLNGAVRDEEIAFFQEQHSSVLASIENASPELQAIRLVINV